MLLVPWMIQAITSVLPHPCCCHICAAATSVLLPHLRCCHICAAAWICGYSNVCSGTSCCRLDHKINGVFCNELSAAMLSATLHML